MNERDWVNKKRSDWERLSALIHRAGTRGGIRALSQEELQEIGPLYRRVTSDLAYARTHAITGDLALYLNSLVGRAYALLYETPPAVHPARHVLNFYLNEFPALLQKYTGCYLITVLLTLIGGLFGYFMVIHNAEALDLFIPEMLRTSVEAWKSGEVHDEAHAGFAAQLMTHNLNVGIVSAVSGTAAGVPTIAMLFSTGGMLGAMTALMGQYNRHAYFWPGIVPHGIAEFTALFICGTAGLLLARAIVLPGRLLRRDALRLYGADAIRLVLGTIPLFIFAGVIEGMFSRLPIPAVLRYGFAALNGIVWYLYLFMPRRELARPQARYGKVPPATE
jgi:uncharacterized membrane protein SpoIIM required for sporulation